MDKEHMHYFTGKNMGTIEKWPILTLFLAMIVTWPPRSTPRGGFLGQLADEILGGWPFKFRKLNWQVDLTSCHLSSDLKRCRRRGWQVNLTSATCQVDFSSSTLCSKHKCRTLMVYVLCNFWARPTQSMIYVPLLVIRFQKLFFPYHSIPIFKILFRGFYSPEPDPPHSFMW